MITEKKKNQIKDDKNDKECDYYIIIWNRNPKVFFMISFFLLMGLIILAVLASRICNNFCETTNAKITNFHLVDHQSEYQICDLYGDLNYTINNIDHICKIYLCDKYTVVDNVIYPQNYFVNQSIVVRFEHDNPKCVDLNYNVYDEGEGSIGIIWV